MLFSSERGCAEPADGGKSGAVKAKQESSQRPMANQLRPAVEVIVLAGGLSSRMGRDKARLRLGARTLLSWVRAAAKATDWRLRVIQRDLVPRCGPLGGVWTAFRRSRAERLVFLSCDMPFVTPDLIRRIAERRGRGVFAHTEEGAGFPFALDRACLPLVEQALAEKQFSLQALARHVCACELRLPSRRLSELQNLNTAEDFARAQAVLCAKALAPSSDAE